MSVTERGWRPLDTGPELTAADDLPPIFIYGLCPWDYIQNRPQHMALGLSKYADVYYIEPPVAFGELLPDRWRAVRHVASPVVESRTVAPRVTVLKTRYRYPFPGTIPAIDRLNRRMLGRALDRVARGLACPPVLWLMYPTAVELLDTMRHSAVVYDLVDKHLDFVNQSTARLNEVERGELRLFAEADAVAATAKSLVRYARQSGAHRVEFIANACDPDHFRSAVRSPRHSETPTIVFVGAIGEWFDFDAVKSVAQALPNATIKLAGPLHDPEDNVPPDLPGNVEYVGRLPFEQLPSLLGDADLALIPFQVNSLTAAVNPVKLYEYMAAGKPVLATPLPEVAAFGDLVTISPAESFGEAAERALEEDTDEAVQRRLAVAAENSWDQRSSAAAKLVREILSSRGIRPEECA